MHVCMYAFNVKKKKISLVLYKKYCNDNKL